METRNLVNKHTWRESNVDISLVVGLETAPGIWASCISYWTTEEEQETTVETFPSNWEIIVFYFGNVFQLLGRGCSNQTHPATKITAKILVQ